MLTEQAHKCPAVLHYHQTAKGFYRCHAGKIKEGRFGSAKQSPFMALLPLLKTFSLN